MTTGSGFQKRRELRKIPITASAFSDTKVSPIWEKKETFAVVLSSCRSLLYCLTEMMRVDTRCTRNLTQSEHVSPQKLQRAAFTFP